MANLQIVVNPDEMARLARDFAAKAQTLADLLSQVNTDLNNMEPYWKGWAKDQFDGLMLSWTGDFKDIQRVLEQVGTLVDQAQVGYTDLDQSIGRHFSH